MHKNYQIYFILSILALSWIACREVHEHIVIDAGSSGTRFCRFQVLPKANGCHSSEREGAFCFKLKRPLARASEPEMEEILSEGLSRLGIATRKNPDSKEPVLILATGGFRALPQEDRKQQIQRISAYFRKRGLSHRAQVLEGKTEGELAHRSMSELYQDSQIRTLETGGATIQLALLNAQGRVEAWSTPLGINQSLQMLRRRPEFRFCYSGSDQKQAVQFEKCEHLLIDFFKKNDDIQNMQMALQRQQRHVQTPLPTFVLGGSWKAILGYVNQKRATKYKIRQAARRLCAQSPAKLMKTGVPRAYARRACYLVSFGSALLEVLGIQEIRLGKESWPRGAAVDGRFYPECRLPQPKDNKMSRK